MLDDIQSTPGESLKTLRGLASRRHFLLGAAAAGATGLAALRKPELRVKPESKKVFESWVPNQVGPWSFLTSSGVVVPPPDALSDRLYDQLVTRVYQSPSEPVVMIALAYNNAQDGVVQLHRPEVCYPAGGYSLTETQPSMMQTLRRKIPVNTFTATGENRTEQVLYWTRIGPDFPLTWAQQRLSVMRANLEGYIPDGILARFSVTSEDRVLAESTLQKFVQLFEKAAAEPLKRVMFR